jgi:hypothetical protein
LKTLTRAERVRVYRRDLVRVQPQRRQRRRTRKTLTNNVRGCVYSSVGVTPPSSFP